MIHTENYKIQTDSFCGDFNFTTYYQNMYSIMEYNVAVDIIWADREWVRTRKQKIWRCWSFLHDLGSWHGTWTSNWSPLGYVQGRRCSGSSGMIYVCTFCKTICFSSYIHNISVHRCGFKIGTASYSFYKSNT